jgi:hypothetical protein
METVRERIGHSGRPNQGLHRFSANVRDWRPSIDKEDDVVAVIFCFGASWSTATTANKIDEEPMVDTVDGTVDRGSYLYNHVDWMQVGHIEFLADFVL